MGNKLEDVLWMNEQGICFKSPKCCSQNASSTPVSVDESSGEHAFIPLVLGLLGRIISSRNLTTIGLIRAVAILAIKK